MASSAQSSHETVKEYHDDPDDSPSPSSSPTASSSSPVSSSEEDAESVPKEKQDDSHKPRYSKKIRKQVS